MRAATGLPMWAVGAALAAHAGIWAGLLTPYAGDGSGGPGAEVQAVTRPAAQAVQVRVAHATSASATTAELPEPDAPQPEAPLDEHPPADVEMTQEGAEDEAEEVADETFGRIGDYIDAALLDSRPQAAVPIEIPYPEGVSDGALYTGVMTLYIDQFGYVRRVQPHDDSLPPPFLEAARNTFLAARFLAGDRDGRVVKSRLDVQVQFDGRQITVVSSLPAGG